MNEQQHRAERLAAELVFNGHEVTFLDLLVALASTGLQLEDGVGGGEGYILAIQSMADDLKERRA